jgi:hypothetical protein
MKKLAISGLIFITFVLFLGCTDSGGGGSFDVTIASFVNGTITAYPLSGVEGTSITLTVLPKTGFKLKNGTLKYNGTNINETTYKFNMPNADVKITADFAYIEYEIGDTGPGGGYIFYDKATASNGWRYMECAAIEDVKNLHWGAVEDVFVGTESDIGTGKSNTEKIFNELEKNDVLIFYGDISSAQFLKNYNGGGYSDWFLPSIDELKEVYDALKVGKDITFPFIYYYEGFDGPESDEDPSYLSSTQDSEDSYTIIALDFENGEIIKESITDKACHILPVRYF